MCIRRGYNVRKKQFDRHDHWETHFMTKVIMNLADDISYDEWDRDYGNGWREMRWFDGMFDPEHVPLYW